MKDNASIEAHDFPTVELPTRGDCDRRMRTGLWFSSTWQKGSAEGINHCNVPLQSFSKVGQEEP